MLPAEQSGRREQGKCISRSGELHFSCVLRGDRDAGNIERSPAQIHLHPDFQIGPE
jgi:hypothetical protein